MDGSLFTACLPLVHADPYTAVRDLTVVIISTSVAKVRWNHTDECEMTDHYQVILVDFTGESVFNDTTKELTKGLVNLQPEWKYEVTVTMIGKDGRRGEATSLVFRVGEECVCVCVCGVCVCVCVHGCVCLFQTIDTLFILSTYCINVYYILYKCVLHTVYINFFSLSLSFQQTVRCWCY